MEHDRAPVEMIRIPRDEEVYDREQVLGRDASSVFPTETNAQAVDVDAVKAALGSNTRFITESELEAIKAERGLRVEDGTIAPMKPLVEVLKEAKEAKEAKFQAVWKSMKVGKNRPLDEDEIDFVERLLEKDRERDRSIREEEREALEAYQKAVQEAAERQRSGQDTGPRLRQQQQQQPSKPDRPSTAPAKRKAALPILRVKPSKPSGAAGDAGAKVAKAAEQPGGANDARTQDNKGDGVRGEEGLQGLLGAYCSGSDSES